ncbi:MAG: HDOD domain-containing protein [Planctomycetota bacterium]
MASRQGAAECNSILDVVNRTVELPTMPEVLVKLNQVVADPDASADDVGAVIARDPAVSANILRMVNSAHFGLQERVGQVSQAVAIMGFRLTKKVALKAAVFSVFANRHSDSAVFDPAGFWRHSIFSGVAARAIAQESPRFAGLDPEDLYICGLLHDIGRIILLESAPDAYQRVLADASAHRASLLDVESTQLGFTHADVGSVLAIKWMLPEDLTIAIRYHHAPGHDPFHQTLSSLIHLADHLAWSAGQPSLQDIAPPQLDVEVYDQVGLEAQQLEDLLPRICDDFAATEMPW